MLNPVADRLEIKPSLAEIADMGRKPRLPAGADPANQSLERMARHQGFCLKLRAKGGPGRLLFRRLCRVSGVQHVMTVREFGRKGLLRVRLYEPLSAVERELRLSPVQRVGLLGSDSADERRTWVKELDKRLSLKRRTGGAFGLHLSTLLCRTALRLCPRLMGLAMCWLEDLDGTGNGLRVAVQRPSDQAEYSVLLTASEVADLLQARDSVDPVKDVLLCGADGGSCGGRSKLLKRRARLDALLKCVSYDEDKDQLVVACQG